MATLLLDENLSERLVPYFQHLGFETLHVRQQPGLGAGATDTQVFRMAQQMGWILVSRDRDFIERPSNANGLPRLIWIRLHGKPNLTLAEWRTFLEGIGQSVADWAEAKTSRVLELWAP